MNREPRREKRPQRRSRGRKMNGLVGYSTCLSSHRSWRRCNARGEPQRRPGWGAWPLLLTADHQQEDGTQRDQNIQADRPVRGNVPSNKNRIAKSAFKDLFRRLSYRCFAQHTVPGNLLLHIFTPYGFMLSPGKWRVRTGITLFSNF